MPKLGIDDLITAAENVAELQDTVSRQDAALAAIQAELKILDERISRLEPKTRRKRA